jgi:hypothetical protein
VFLVYTFVLPGETNPDDYIHEDKTVVQPIPDGLTQNEAYKIEVCLRQSYSLLIIRPSNVFPSIVE